MKSKILLTFFAVLGFNAANSQTAELSPVCTSSVKTYGVDETEENTVYYWEGQKYCQSINLCYKQPFLF